jgi:hypothetical protein
MRWAGCCQIAEQRASCCHAEIDESQGLPQRPSSRKWLTGEVCTLEARTVHFESKGANQGSWKINGLPELSRALLAHQVQVQESNIFLVASAPKVHGDKVDGIDPCCG